MLQVHLWLQGFGWKPRGNPANNRPSPHLLVRRLGTGIKVKPDMLVKEARRIRATTSAARDVASRLSDAL